MAKVLERRREVVRVRHGRPFDEHRDDVHLLLPQGGLDLDPYVVVGVVEATGAGCISRKEPVLAYEDEEDLAAGDGRSDGTGEVLTRRERVDVAEHHPRPEL